MHNYYELIVKLLYICQILKYSFSYLNLKHKSAKTLSWFPTPYQGQLDLH